MELRELKKFALFVSDYLSESKLVCEIIALSLGGIAAQGPVCFSFNQYD